LQISDKEHRVLLKGVTEEEAVCRIRQSRQTGGTQSSSHHSSVVHTPVPAKRQKKSHSVPVTPQAPVITMHAVVGKKVSKYNLFGVLWTLLSTSKSFFFYICSLVTIGQAFTDVQIFACPTCTT
jgi:hypothetical protein